MEENLYHEVPQNHLHIAHSVKEVITEKTTEFQKAAIVDTMTFGRSLFLDGILNSSEQDEFIYHEALVHPAMVRAKKRDNVLIIGGAEGGTLREVLKYNDVQNATMVEIDGELVDLCKEYLGDLYGDPWSDSRANLKIDDGREYLKGDRAYDVIILDLNEPEEGNPALGLYTKEFYGIVRDSLSPGGVMSSQAGWIHSESHFHLTATQRSVFADVQVLEASVPGYLMTEALNLCSAESEALSIEPKTINEILDEQGIETRYFDGEVDLKMRTLPSYLRQKYEEVGRIRTDENPLDINESNLIIS